MKSLMQLTGIGALRRGKRIPSIAARTGVFVSLPQSPSIEENPDYTFQFYWRHYSYNANCQVSSHTVIRCRNPLPYQEELRSYPEK